MKRILYLFCAAFLAGSCTNDPTTAPSPGATSAPGELVPVSLALHMPPYSPPPRAQSVRSVQASGVSSGGVVRVEISAAPLPAATRTGKSGFSTGIPDDDKIFDLDILQFNGVGNNAQLILKQHLAQPDGDLSLYDLKDLRLTASTVVANRIVVVCNADRTAFFDHLTPATPQAASYTGGSTYDEFLQMSRSRASQTDMTFPRVSRGLTAPVNVPVITGNTTSTIASGSQVGVELLRTIARANFEFKLSPKMQTEYSHWDILLNNIPATSFYNPQGRSEPFPSDPGYYSQVLGLNVESAPTPLLKTLYLPVNLQASVPGTTSANRYLNAPLYATNLQLLGKKIVDGNTTQIVVFQIPLGSNFTDNYSIYANYQMQYEITLVDDSADDSSVIKFIAGKFGGKLTGYDAANQEVPFTPGQNSPTNSTIVRFQYASPVEVWPSDVTAKDFGDPLHPNFGEPIMPWGILSASADPFPVDLGADWLWDGRGNTQKLCGQPASWYLPYAAYSCYRQLNGISTPYASVQEAPCMWYLPAINELLSVYVAAGAQIPSMQSSYWSSSIIKKTGGIKWAYRLRKNGIMELLDITAPGAVVPTAAVRGCRQPPPAK